MQLVKGTLTLKLTVHLSKPPSQTAVYGLLNKLPAYSHNHTCLCVLLPVSRKLVDEPITNNCIFILNKVLFKQNGRQNGTIRETADTDT